MVSHLFIHLLNFYSDNHDHALINCDHTLLLLNPRFGLDLVEGVVRDNKKAGVLEPTVSKIKSLKFATEAAITILRIDDMIKLEPEPGEEKSYPMHGGGMDE